MADENKTESSPAVAPQVPAPAIPMVPEQARAVPQPGAPAQDEKLFAVIGYFAFLFVLPLIVKPKSAFCKFHAKQSMVMFLITIVVLVVLGTIPLVGSLLTLALFALYVLAIYKAYLGELWAIPVISKFATKVDVDQLYNTAGLAVAGISGLKEQAAGFAAKATDAAKGLGKPGASQEPPDAPPAQTPPELPKKA